MSTDASNKSSVDIEARESSSNLEDSLFLGASKRSGYIFRFFTINFSLTILSLVHAHFLDEPGWQWLCMMDK